MTVRANKPAFNVREKLKELERPIGLKGSELMRAETTQEARDFVSAGRKNMIINGGMNIFQRNNSGLITSGTYLRQYAVDRFGGQFQAGNVFTAERADNDAPPGFRYSLKYTTTNAVTPNTLHYFHVGQAIEGYNFQQCGWNTSNPKHITLSFWVKSSVTGTWALAFRTGTSANTGYFAPYEINVANTWEYKTITVPPPPTLTDLQYTNSKALTIQFDLGTSRSGDLYASARNKWVNENIYADASTVKIHGIAGATWQITGVQLEVGKNATEFEHRSYGEELALCQRYCFKIAYEGGTTSLGIGEAHSSTEIDLPIRWPVPMRSVPTLADQGSGSDYYRIEGGGSTSWVDGNWNFQFGSTHGGNLYATPDANLTAGRAHHITMRNSAAYISFSAEL